METIFAILIGASAIGVFIWLLIPGPTRATKTGDELIDASDSRQLGQLVGLAGGTVADAAVARYALERFEQIHGRKATTRDAGIVAGLISGMK